MRKIRSDYEAMAGAGNLIDFQAEYLGWVPEATAAKWAVISEATWEALRVSPTREAYQDPVALGVDATPDQSYASIGMAARTVMGDTFVEHIERKPGLSWTVPALVKIAKDQGACAIGIAAHGPAAPLIEPLQRALNDAYVNCELVMMQGPAVSRACRQLYIETGEVGELDLDDPSYDVNRRVVHIGNPELNASVASAQKYTFGDEWRWQRQGTGGDPAPLYAVTLARAAGESVEWVGGSYDIMKSLGQVERRA